MTSSLAEASYREKREREGERLEIHKAVGARLAAMIERFRNR